MTFEFTADPGFDFLHSFSEAFGIPVSGDVLQIPPEMGEGSIRKIDFGGGFRLVFHRHTFHQDFVLRRVAPREKHDLVTMIFYSSGFPKNRLSNPERSFECTQVNTSSIEISSNDLTSEIHFAARKEIRFTVLGIRATVLAELLGVEEPNCLLNKIIGGTDTFLYHEFISPDIEHLLKTISDHENRRHLGQFYVKVKVQELLYLLFTKLLKRADLPQNNISTGDIEKLYAIRAELLADLSSPPQLSLLARQVSMSETKMKQLFRQVFGDSIYNYYQNARMDEAAALLRHSGMSVSEIGYQLGFSNLSHFGRIFQKHHGQTPKKFQLVG